ncbi:MAG: DUF3817 domain-containing protein [Planctomycetes bacterium]|nr:DUF3817 domain-containing protein [Planctomycetota bacterium]
MNGRWVRRPLAERADHNKSTHLRKRNVLSNPVGVVRTVGTIEGVSALILFFIAMPLKYVAKIPEGEAIVFWVGLVHGILFTLYAAVTFIAWGKGAITAKLVGMAAVASIVPFGPFVIDRKLKAVEPTPDTATASG